MDVDARVQLFDLKTVYKFQTIPGIDKYNMPLYSVQTQPGNQNIAPFPVYQGFTTPCFVNGIETGFSTERNNYFNVWPNYTQFSNPAIVGDGTAGPYYIPLPFFPAMTGHIDMTGIISYFNSTGTYADPIYTLDLNLDIPTTSVNSAVFFTSTDINGNNVVVADSGQFLQGSGDGSIYGLLMKPGNAPYGNSKLTGGYSTTKNTVNYSKGYANVVFPTEIPVGTNINAQCYFYSQGIPRSILFYNNTITIRPPPDIQYAVELGAYLTPAAFLNTAAAVPFAYMSEYIARGAARKILADTGDIEQFNFYEPLFKEQETLVWKRSQRIFTSTRTQTIFSQSLNQNRGNIYGNNY